MKKINLLLLLFTFTSSFSQEKVSLNKIDQYEGKIVTICEKVQSTFLSKNSKTTMLNFGKPYPNQTFIITIFEKDLVNFSYEPSIFLKGKTVCVTGTVIIYKGMPEIIIKDEKDILIQ
ncbi:hypothetical protein OX283_003135 [Flavobacterium sp. SUN052]|uniref:hypothetical protein n=1 Tax=Flavobacterium sp. SUN052 TaxID=3002441 RepID=UPI00237E8999|nr:hypothetical protein [Flavobacterium sp. SUN052]MEC4003641.1 hypothetical protein [Flavobacterium sp. SUN052]